LTNLNKFERGNVDVFSVKVGLSLGELTMLKMGFDASGLGSDWLLDSVTITHVQTKKEWMFIYQKELSSSNRSVELVATNDSLKETYLMKVSTGDEFGAGTDSNVFVRLIGSDFSSYEVELSNSIEHVDKFERAQIDTFELVVPRHLGVIRQLEIRFSPATVSLGAKWLLDSVKVSRRAKPTDSVPDEIAEVLFIAKRWMNADKNRLLLEATNPADVCDYAVSIFTGDEFGAGTDGDVFMTLFGDSATSDEIPLEASMTHKDKFERGHEDKFIISTPKPLGSNMKCKIRFKPPTIGSNTWLLDRVNVSLQKSPDSYSGELSWEFPFCRWFSKTLLSMEQTSGKGFTYAVSVFTGTKSGAGTDANVHMEMWDALGVSSGRHILETSKTHTNKFENGQCDVFHVTVPKALDAISKLLIGHDNSAIAGNDWFLDRVEVIAFSTNENPIVKPVAHPVVFPCFRWLKHPDLEVMLTPGVHGVVHTYTVRIWTGDEPDCGTDANIRIELLEAGGLSSGVHKLAKSFDHLDKFERGNYDTFKLEVPAELGELASVKIYSDIEKDHWLLDKIVVWDNYACAASCNTPGVAIDESSWADVSKSVLKGNHPHRWLFPLKSWITSSDPVTIDAAPVNSTVDMKKADGFSDEPALISYEVAIFTGDLKDASASGPISIKLIGSKSTSSRQLLKSTSAGTAAKFERGGHDLFSVATVKDLGVINSVWVSHDPGISLLGSAAWYLDYVVVKRGHSEGVRFNCRRWLDKVSREVTLQPYSSEDSIYIVRVVTGDEQDAGTNANVFLEMFFESGSLPIQKLAQSDRRDKFERGQTDTFEVLVPQSLKGLKSIAISSDGSGFGSKWLLSHVELEILGKGVRTTFPCGQWLQKTRLILAPGGLLDVAQADGLIVKSAQPVVFKYTVLVETGDVVMAGTDANVMIAITGSKSRLPEKKLTNSKTFMNKFERV
jgi:lipoxygenase homology domain-containing protein 1